jgi:cytochrome c oxidase assembly factor CtaG
VISIDPAGLAVLALLVALHVRAVRTLARRGHRTPRWQLAAFYGGVGLIAFGLFGPLDSLGEELLVAHMGQHLLIADLAAPLLLVGIRSPVMFFMVPRPLLAVLARQPWLRRLSRFVRRPLVALPVYLAVLYTWHLAFAFDAALDSPPVHALQHQSFVAIGLLVWWPVLEPNRSRLRGELWKAGYVLGTRVMTMFIGMAFLIQRTPAYDGYDGAHGLSALSDQQLAGGLMMVVDLLIMLGALAFFFWRAGVDHDRAEAERAQRQTAAAR